MNRASTGVVAAAASLTLLAGCGTGGGGPTAGGFPMTVQNCGRTVTIDRPPNSVLTIGPEAADMVRAAGGLDKITAHQAEFPTGSEDAFRGIRQLPGERPPGTEAIIAEHPDLVVSYGLTDSNPQSLAASGIQSLVLSGMCGSHDDGVQTNGPIDFEDVYADLELYGRLFGTSEVAARTLADMRERVRAVQQRVDRGTPRSAAVLWPGTGDVPFAYGTASITHAELAMLGLRDVFGEIEGFGREISKEELIDRNPEVVVLYLFGEDPAQAVNQLRAIPGVADLAAFRDGHVMTLQSTYLRPSASAVRGLEIMADQLASYR